MGELYTTTIGLNPSKIKLYKFIIRLSESLTGENKTDGIRRRPTSLNELYICHFKHFCVQKIENTEKTPMNSYL